VKKAAKTLPKIISREDVEKLLAVPNTSCPTGLRNRTALELMYRAGLRVSEVAGLKPRDVRWETGEVLVDHGKGDKDRVVPLDAEAINWLRLWRKDAKHPKGAPTFFCTLKGGPLSTEYLRQVVKRCARKAGLDPAQVSPHKLRHSYATELLDEGFTIREVQELLGHSSITTTQIYTHVRPNGLAEKIRQRRQATVDAVPTVDATLAAAIATIRAATPEDLEAAMTAGGEQNGRD